MFISLNVLENSSSDLVQMCFKAYDEAYPKSASFSPFPTKGVYMTCSDVNVCSAEL